MNEQTKAIEEQIVGTFTQYPLRHAWAITIHKSQGLTFDRCIIDAQAAFASGQVYVALSRCKSFEGIVLRTRIVSNSVKTDPVVKEFSAEAEKNIPTEAQLRAAKHECQTSALHSLFQFDEISEFIQKLIIHGQHLSQSLTSETVNSFATLQQKAFADLQDVSKKFSPQLAAYLLSTELPEENEALQARLRKASSYFVDKILLLMKEVDAITIETDNKEVATQFASALSNLKRLFITKKFCFAACSDGFTAERISRAKCDAELEIIEPHLNREMTVKVPKDVPHPKLYERLAAWRFDMAIERDLPEFDIAPNLTLKDLTTTLPKTKRQLTNIRGIGKARLQKYGDALLKLILDYCQEHGIDTDSTPNPSIASAARPDKSQTKKVTLELFRAGKTIEEIATARSLAISTIESHLSHFVEKGELDISLFLDETSFGEIVQYLNVTPDSTTSMSKEHFGDKYSYGQLKLAYAAWSRLAE